MFVVHKASQSCDVKVTLLGTCDCGCNGVFSEQARRWARLSEEEPRSHSRFAGLCCKREESAEEVDSAQCPFSRQMASSVFTSKEKHFDQ